MSYQDQDFTFSNFSNYLDREDNFAFGFDTELFRNNSYDRNNSCDLERKPSYLESPHEIANNFSNKIEEKPQVYEEEQQQTPQTQCYENQNNFVESNNYELSQNNSEFFFDFGNNQVDAHQQLPVIEESGLEFFQKKPEAPQKKFFTIIIEIDDDLIETCASSRQKQEESLSIATKENSDSTSTDKDQVDFQSEFKCGESNININVEWKSRILNNIRHKSEDEKTYVNSVMPALLDALGEAFTLYNPVLPTTIIDSLVKELINGKEYMIKTENKHLKQLVHQEINEVRGSIPQSMIEEEDLYESKRKGKKVIKGNINHSSLNHMNENYVSNIFQFSKQNFQEDKELQRIANTRNVSATNFRKLTQANLSDGLMVRKAKVRILASGKELINNVEYWMNDGYFSQCNDKEKYIMHKDKAINDLALE